MRVIQPKPIVLTATSVSGNTESEWSAGTTYGKADLVQVTTSTPHKVYRSLRANNIGKIPAQWLVPQTETSSSTTSTAVATGSKTFTTQTGKGFSAGMIVKISSTVIPSSINMTGEVSSYDTATGALQVIVASVSGSGTYADWTISTVDEIGFWEEIGATNQWSMFDEYVNTKTTDSTDIEITLTTSGTDHIALFGIEGTNVEFELWNPSETVRIWSATKDLIYGSLILLTIGSWYDYFFGAYSVKTDINQRIPVLVENGILKIKIVAFPDGAACGACVVGRTFEIGKTLYGASAGMVDFSYRDEDESGRIKITQGYWAKRNNIPLSIDNIYLDTAYKIVTSLRGIPTAWIGNNEDTGFESFIVFGIFKDFEVTVPGPSLSTINLEIEGFI